MAQDRTLYPEVMKGSVGVIIGLFHLIYVLAIHALPAAPSPAQLLLRRTSAAERRKAL